MSSLQPYHHIVDVVDNQLVQEAVHGRDATGVAVIVRSPGPRGQVWHSDTGSAVTSVPATGSQQRAA